MSRIAALRYHDICAGHRVVGHESKCRNLHGHNYRFHFYVRPVFNELDAVGRVIDFSMIRSYLCDWLEANWDHKMLLWEEDILAKQWSLNEYQFGVITVPFNPTAENIAQHFVDVVAPDLLAVTGVELYKLRIEETRKCGVEYEK